MAKPTATIIPDLTQSAQAQQAVALAEQEFDFGVVETDADFRRVTEQTQELAGIRKEIEEARKAIKRPILDAGRAVDDFFNAALARVKPKEDAARNILVAFKQRREREIKEAQEAEAAQVAGGSFVPSGFGAIKQLSTMPASAPAAATGFATRKTYSARVDDLAALVAFCHASGNFTFLLPNQQVLDAAAKQAKADRPLDIPGVSVVETESAVLR